jgi:hypothetical protein
MDRSLIVTKRRGHFVCPEIKDGSENPCQMIAFSDIVVNTASSLPDVL